MQAWMTHNRSPRACLAVAKAVPAMAGTAVEMAQVKIPETCSQLLLPHPKAAFQTPARTSPCSPVEESHFCSSRSTYPVSHVATQLAVFTYAPVCALHIRFPMSSNPSLHVGMQIEPGESVAVQLPTSPSCGAADASHDLDAHAAGDVAKQAPVSEH